MTILDILEEHNIEFRRHGEHHHSTEGFVNIDCPRCGKDTQSFRLGINLEHNFSTCWVCGFLPLSQIMGEALNVTAKQFLFSYGDYLDVSIVEKKLPTNRKLELPKKLLPTLHSAHRKYLKSRGFDPNELVKLWGIKGIGLAAHHQWSVFIPVFQHGVLVNWLTRSIAPDAPKRYQMALSTQILVDRENCLLGLDYVRHATVCVEGGFDVFAIGPGSCATLGISYSKEQVLMLSKIPVRGILFDSESGAQIQARKLCDELSCFEGATTNIVLETGKDPAECIKTRLGRLEIQEIRKRFLE